MQEIFNAFTHRIRLRHFLSFCLVLSVIILGCESVVFRRSNPIHAADSGGMTAQTAQTAWTQSMRGLYPFTGANFSCRYITRPSIAGNAIRIRLSNVFGTTSLTFKGVSASIRMSEANVTSVKKVLFKGITQVTIPAGKEIISDRITLAVKAQQDVAVSVYVPGSNPPFTEHPYSSNASYCTDPNGKTGDHIFDTSGNAYKKTSIDPAWVSAVDVFPSSTTGAIVALGDSITDGAASTLDGNDRWEDILSRRLLMLPNAQSVNNAGIAGNMVCSNPASWGPGAVDRLDRDVLKLSTVRYVILFEGTNDISYDNATGGNVISCIQNIIKRVHAAGIKVVVATIIPRSFDSVQEKYRTQVNTWIRMGKSFDGVIDFDKVVRDPKNPVNIASIYDSGDQTHPNVEGYAAMGKSINLSLFGHS